MGKLGWSILSGIIGIIIGALGGVGLGAIGGAVGGATAGSVVGVCKAAKSGVDQGLFDTATADKLVASTVAAIDKGVSTSTKFTSLASCAEVNTL
jgi:hypothetical protein